MSDKPLYLFKNKVLVNPAESPAVHYSHPLKDGAGALRSAANVPDAGGAINILAYRRKCPDGICGGFFFLRVGDGSMNSPHPPLISQMLLMTYL